LQPKSQDISLKLPVRLGGPQADGECGFPREMQRIFHRGSLLRFKSVDIDLVMALIGLKWSYLFSCLNLLLNIIEKMNYPAASCGELSN